MSDLTILPLLRKALEAVELLDEIRCHPRRHDLDRDWLTRADAVIGYWNPPRTKVAVRDVIAEIERAAPAVNEVTK